MQGVGGESGPWALGHLPQAEPLGSIGLQSCTITFLCPRFYIPLSTPLLRLRVLCPTYRLQAPILYALLQRLPTITPLLPSLHVLLRAARPEVKFLWVRAQELMQAHLPNKLAGVAYHPALCAHLAAVLSAEIQDLVKTVTPPHYRLVCSVSIGSKGQDSVVVSSGCLWDPHADSFAISHYVNPTLFSMALVHAIYLE